MTSGAPLLASDFIKSSSRPGSRESCTSTRAAGTASACTIGRCRSRAGRRGCMSGSAIAGFWRKCKSRPARPTRAPRPRRAASPAARIKAPKGFQVDLIYSVPQATQGSWVNMTVDPKGRLIVSDQYGKLYRVTLPPIGSHRRCDRRRADRCPDRRGARLAVGLRQPLRGRQPRPAIQQRPLSCHGHE